MILKFYGVRGSYPTPEKKFLKYGGNTPSVMVKYSKYAIIFDGGTGIIKAGKDLLKEKDIKEIYIFISHFHYDHIHGIPFFKLFFEKSSKKIKILGPSFSGKSFENLLDKYIKTPFIPFSIKELKGKEPFELKTFKKEDKIRISEEAFVKTIYSSHHPLQGIHLFSFIAERKITYITDIELTDEIIEELSEFARGSDILIFDSFLTKSDKENRKRSFGHSSFEDALKIKKISNSSKLYFFHYNPEYTDEKLDNLKNKFEKDGAFMSYEGLEVKLED